MRDEAGGQAQAQAYFEQLWAGDQLGWTSLGRSQWRAVYDRQLALLGDRCYRRVLELGCGGGDFTARLATLAGDLVALDIAPAAVALARSRLADAGPVDLRVADAIDFDVLG